jgi:hypothetical protein
LYTARSLVIHHCQPECKEDKKNNKECKKYIGINVDLEDFLIELGMNEKIETNEYILFPDRDVKTKTIMTDLSRIQGGFSSRKGCVREPFSNNIPFLKGYQGNVCFLLWRTY